MEPIKGYSIAYKGLKNGTHDFSFEVGRALFEAFESPEIKDGACSVKVRMQRAETLLTLDVSITGGVIVACDRCLEDCRVPIDFEGELLVKFSDEVREYDGDVLWLLPGEDYVDLAQYIYESIVLSLPYQRVHPDGECDPEMIGRFNIVSENEFSAIEARAKADNDGEWSKLEALKRQMEAQAQTEEAPAAEKTK